MNATAYTQTINYKGVISGFRLTCLLGSGYITSHWHLHNYSLWYNYCTQNRQCSKTKTEQL